jgi:hypothetical protein
MAGVALVVVVVALVVALVAVVAARREPRSRKFQPEVQPEDQTDDTAQRALKEGSFLPFQISNHFIGVAVGKPDDNSARLPPLVLFRACRGKLMGMGQKGKGKGKGKAHQNQKVMCTSRT